MSLYNVEIFKPDYSYRSSAQIQDISYEYDYLSITNNKIKLQDVDVSRGDYIRITKGSRKIFGIVKGVSDSDTVTVEYMSILSMFDTNVYANVLSIISAINSPLEDWIINTIKENFVQNSDALQNIKGMELISTSETLGKKKLGYDSNIFNLYELITKALTQHAIVIDADINITDKVIALTIGTRQTEEKHIEADLPNILGKEFSIEKGSEAVNKVIVVNEENQSIRRSYYLLADGTVSHIADEANRISPVIFDTVFITVADGESFTDKSYDEAVAKLVPDEYDNYISITVSNEDSLVKPDEWLIGQKAAIIHKGRVYHTILTGIKIDKRTTLMFGAVRKELTKKLKRRMLNGR